MNDGWVSIYEESPAAGQTVEIRASDHPDAISGQYTGTCTVKVSPTVGEDWALEGPNGTLYILYWRRVQ